MRRSVGLKGILKECAGFYNQHNVTVEQTGIASLGFHAKLAIFDLLLFLFFLFSLEICNKMGRSSSYSVVYLLPTIWNLRQFFFFFAAIGLVMKLNKKQTHNTATSN